MTEVLLIVGMHRSGTSALAGAVAQLGLPLGEQIVPGQERDNPKGFFEHAEVVAAHDALLTSAGRTWDDPSLWIGTPPVLPGLEAFRNGLHSILQREARAGAPWAVKDPRMCRLLPMWTAHLREEGIEARVLLIHRDPIAVASSLFHRDGFSPEKASLLWLDHVLGAERHSRGLRRAAVSYDELVRSPVETLRRCGEALDLVWPRSPAACRAGLEAFLRRPPSAAAPHRGAAPGGSTVAALAARAWRELERTHPALPDPALLDRARRETIEQGPRADALLLEHLGQVLERTVEGRVWGRTAPIEERLSQTRAVLDGAASDLNARLAALEGGLAGSSTQAELLSAFCAELKHQGEVLHATRTELGALGAEIGAVARELDRLSRQTQDAVRGQRETLDWLAGRVDQVESRRAWPLRLWARWTRRRA